MASRALLGMARRWHYAAIMVRVQIQLTEEQNRALRRWADQLGISLAEAVRRCVSERLQREDVTTRRVDRVREARAVIGKYASGKADIGRRHDDYLTDAYEE